jgi:hypothetical protein
MNKPVAQLELVPVTSADAKPSSSNIDPKLIADVIDAGADANLVGRVANATSAAALVDRLVAEAGPDDFDWSSDDDAIVVRPRPGIAIYRNKFDDIVIRSQNATGDDDYFAYVSPEGVPAVIKALKDCLS